MTGLHKSPGSSQRSQGTGKEVSLRLDNLGVDGVLLDGRNAFLQRRVSGIGLALADDLRVLRLQDKIFLAVLRGLDLEAGGISGVLLDGGDALLCVGQRLVLLAGQNHLAVGGLQVEEELPVRCGLDLEFTRHCILPGYRWMTRPHSEPTRLI